MLDLGCGAGGYDSHCSEHFLVTGVDISEGMLALTKKRIPKASYVAGDMRLLGINRKLM